MRSPLFHHPRLMNEATMLGTEAILHQLPAPHTPELEAVIRQAVKQSLLHYADSLATRERQLHPLHQAKARG
jgi:hypothetical protein